MAPGQNYITCIICTKKRWAVGRLHVCGQATCLYGKRMTPPSTSSLLPCRLALVGQRLGGTPEKCTGSGAPLGGFSRTAPVSDISCSETGTKRIGSSFPLDPASVTERGTLEPGQPSVPIPLSQAFGTLESGLQRRRKTLSKNHGTRQLQVISSD